MNKIIYILFIIIPFFTKAQQLNCTVTVNSAKASNSNQQVYKTLQSSLTEFINKTDWTGQNLKQNEKLNCSFFITVNSVAADEYTASLQIQSSRLIYNSSYSTPIFNYNDKDFNFKYVEFENLNYNPNSYDSNLVSLISYYCYIILGMNADTFQPLSGNSYFESAQNILNIAQQSNYKGWKQNDGNQNRYFLVTDLLSQTYFTVRQAQYDYNTGLDLMANDIKNAKAKIINSIINLSKINTIKPNAFLTRIFFDAKADEIVSIFSGGPALDTNELIDNLNKLSPLNSSKWIRIK